MKSLKAQDVRVTYGHGSRAVQAVRGVSLAFSADRSLGIAGESGSGKSTLARALVGLLQPGSGTVEWGGRSILELPKHGPGSLTRTVQMVFQDPGSSLNQRMTVGDTLREALAVNAISGDHKAEVERLLNQVELKASDAVKYPYQFSGGQKQRIALARALAVRPEVLVCDEMTSALDVSVQAAILNLLREVRRETGLALAVVTHNLDVVRYLCDDVVVMRSGEVVEHGGTGEVFSDPQDLYTKRLLAAVPKFRFEPFSELVREKA